MAILKEMVYKTERTKELLAIGELMGFQYFIISYGTHPCCYVRIPEGHELFGMHYDDIYYESDYDIRCHGGLTFSERYLLDSSAEGWYIGWDYAHHDDYSPFFDCDGEKWTVSRLMAEVTEVICALATKP